MKIMAIVTLWTCVLAMCANIFLTPAHWSQRIAVNEAHAIEKCFGAKRASLVGATTRGVLDTYIVKSGVYDGLRDFLLPSPDETDAQGPLANFTRPVFTWAAHRIDAWVAITFVICQRVILIAASLCLMWIVPVIAILDGVLNRRIKQAGFVRRPKLSQFAGSRRPGYFAGAMSPRSIGLERSPVLWRFVFTLARLGARPARHRRPILN